MLLCSIRDSPMRAQEVRTACGEYSMYCRISMVGTVVQYLAQRDNVTRCGLRAVVLFLSQYKAKLIAQLKED